MSRRKILVASCGIVILLVASYFIGVFYSQYSTISGPELPPSYATMTEAASPFGGTAKDQTTSQERVVIYNGHISLETKDIQGTLQRIRGLAEGNGGYVASSSRSTYGTQTTAQIAIRVPKDQFRSSIQQIEAYGKILDEGTNSEDITQQYIDLKARLNNLQKQEERLQEILGMAKTVEDILRVETELGRIRGEIDSLQGQINYLEGNAEMSLISVTLTEPLPAFMPPGMNWGETFEIAIVGFFTILRGIIILSISLMPIIVIGAPVYYLYKRREKSKTR